MKYYIFLRVILFGVLSFELIKKGDKCLCEQIMIEKECKQLGSCIWDYTMMTCNTIKAHYQIEFDLVSNSNAQSISLYCEQFDDLVCPFQKSCAWFAGKCRAFPGCTAFRRNTNQECSELSKNCITDGSKCVMLDDCYTYMSPFTCITNKIGKYCFWNQQNGKCEDVNECSQLPSFFKTNEECQEHLSQCHAKKQGGCIQIAENCSEILEEIGCISNRMKTMECFWSFNKCLDKQCFNAPSNYKTDEECQLFNKQCTTKSGGGCIERTICKDFQIEQNCVLDQLGQQCMWNNGLCFDKQCENAPSWFTTNEQCKQIQSFCITNGNGCLTNKGCASATLQLACQQDQNGNDCIWKVNNCQKKQCKEAGQQYKGYDQCASYMKNCTASLNDEYGCIDKTCDNAPTTISSTIECENYLPNNQCIFNPKGGCMQKKTCYSISTQDDCFKDQYENKCYWDAYNSNCQQLNSCQSIKYYEACVVDFLGMDCQWIPSQLDKQKGQCVNKACHTAPNTLIHENECQQYFQSQLGTICTTKKNGGCKIKRFCTDSDYEQSCTYDGYHKPCFWETNLNKCREKECYDYEGTTHLECYQQNQQCTIGLQGKCEKITKCNDIQLKNLCIFGSDGPCLWVEQYKNQNGSKGICLQFDSCNSIKWKTDQECKQLSNQCTTNGQTCIPITECFLTNITGGCVTGTEGECIQSVPALFSTQQPKCQMFFFCDQAYYLTHDECQRANKKCTTNGITGCRGLTSCENYIKEACHFNNLGTQYNQNGQIISTGKCVWDQTEQICRDEICSDITFSDPFICQQTLFQCTSDGQACVEKDNCFNYQNEFTCNSREGIDGPCIWIENNQQYQCQQKSCDNIIQGNDQAKCEQVIDCISDGQKCIKKNECQYYSTLIACNQNGIDGLCIWNHQTNMCNLMKQCDDAIGNQAKCLQVSDRCFWNQLTNQCLQHTCETYNKQIGDCKAFHSFDQEWFHLCKLEKNKCIFVDANTLNEENCLTNSMNLYCWNPINNKCIVCEKTKYSKKEKSYFEQGNVVPITQAGFILSLIIVFLLHQIL